MRYRSGSLKTSWRWILSDLEKVNKIIMKLRSTRNLSLLMKWKCSAKSRDEHLIWCEICNFSFSPSCTQVETHFDWLVGLYFLSTSYTRQWVGTYTYNLFRTLFQGFFLIDIYCVIISWEFIYTCRSNTNLSIQMINSDGQFESSASRILVTFAPIEELNVSIIMTLVKPPWYYGTMSHGKCMWEVIFKSIMEREQYVDSVEITWLVDS